MTDFHDETTPAGRSVPRSSESGYGLGVGREDSEEPEGGGSGFLDHLEELRWRLIRIIVAVFIAAAVALYFGEEIFKFAVRPLGDIELHVTAITGSFYSYLTVSLFTGLFAVIPYVFYQLWSFIAPGLYKTERRAILPAVLASSVLFLLGAAFAFTLALPFSIQYLVSFAGDVLTPIITVDSYLSFAGMIVLAFGIGFNFPTLAFFLGKIGLVTAEGLAKGRRVALLLILVAAAIITPPDVFTQLMLGGPLYLLYELSIVLVRWTSPGDRV